MEELRPLLIVYAYNILGAMEAAKDVVQDVFLKFIQINQKDILDQKSYLVRMVINQAIDEKKKQKKMLAAYPGQWLPEPVTTENPDSAIHRKDILSYSLMVLLEKLNPRQRAVFILKEAFDYDHEEIGAVLGISSENSRKILSRAREQLQSAEKPRPAGIQMEQLNKYINILYSGDTSRLEQLLTEDISVLSDGGGKAVAFMNPVLGRDAVLALVSGLQKKFYKDAHFEKGMVNHQPAVFYFEGDQLVTCQIFSFVKDRIAAVFFIRNPDKLRELQKNFG